MQLLVARLDAKRLGRISRHFGFAATYALVTSQAPEKTQDFLDSSSTSFLDPVAGEYRFGPNGRMAPALKQTTSISASMLSAVYRPAQGARVSRVLVAGVGQFLDYTPYEIYLSFRTAPIGALGVTGALWEATVAMAAPVSVAYYGGSALGSNVVAPLIQTYAPTLWDAIGGTIDGIVTNLQNCFTQSGPTQAQTEKSSAAQFESTPTQMGDFPQGGDYDVAESWADYGGGSGGSTIPVNND